jgi:hypothetical protein
MVVGHCPVQYGGSMRMIRIPGFVLDSNGVYPRRQEVKKQTIRLCEMDEIFDRKKIGNG